MLRKSTILVSFLFVLSLAITGCGGGGDSVNPTGPALTSNATASLSGTVSFDSSPTPFASVYLYKSDKAHTVGMTQLSSLRGALVAQQIIANGAYSTTTNAEGVYSFVDIPVGEYTLIAVRDENHQSVQTGVLLGQVTSLNPQLTPTGKITGNLSLTAGSTSEGVGGAFVYINGTNYIAVTNAAGDFTINNVPSNSNSTTKYEIMVLTTKGSAAPLPDVVVNPGVTTTLGNIALTAASASGYTILNGSLVADSTVTSTELAQQLVFIMHETSKTVFATLADTAGNFQFRVYETGTYLVLGNEKGYSYDPKPLSIDVVGSNNNTTILDPITVSKDKFAQPPTSLAASSTDSSITFTWQNAPFINEVEIRLLQAATEVRAPQRITGNSYTYDKLLANTNYTIEISSTYPNVANSASATLSFSTKATGIKNIQTAEFTGSIATGTVFAFEVVGNTAYVGFDDSGSITIQSFNLTTNALIASSNQIVSTSDLKLRSLAANSGGVYLTYGGSETELPMIAVFGSNLSAPTTTENISGLFTTTIPSDPSDPSESRVRCLNNRIFLVNRISSGIDLREINSSLTTIASSTTTSPSGQDIDLAYDPVTNTIYLVGYGSNEFIVSAFSNMNVSIVPSEVGSINVSSNNLCGLYAFDNNVYLTLQANGYITTGKILTAGGYVSSLLNPYGSVGFDQLGRIWVYNYSSANTFLLQIDRGQAVLQSLKIFNSDYMAKELAPKLDTASGMMYMPHFNATNKLAVYKYSSNF